MPETQLGIFAKYPAPGKVKTRLAASIGDDAASRLYRAFVETLLARFADCADTRVLAYWPAEQRAEFRELLGDLPWRLQPQSDGDLGARMRHYFQTAVADGVRRVVLIGSDSPTLPQRFIEQAFERLEHHQVVLGPSEDGGYYLIGIREPVPPIFHGIAWSTSAVWQETTKRLDAAGIRYATLPGWYDVDDESDLHRLRDEIGRPAADGGEFVELRRALLEASQ